MDKDNQRFYLNKQTVFEDAIYASSDEEWMLSELRKTKTTETNLDWNLHIDDVDSEVMNTVHSDINKHMHENETEKLVIIQKTPSVKKHEKVGDRIDRVEIDAETKAILRAAEKNSLVFSHVHPGKTSFSKADLRIMIEYESVSDLTLELGNGDKRILSRKNYEGPSFRSIRLKKFDKTYKRIYDEIAKKYPQLENIEEAYDVWDDFIEEVNAAVAKEMGMEYKVIRND